jgi:hypothetical protein
MRHETDAALPPHFLNRLLDTPQARDGLLNIKRNQVTFERCDLYTRDEVEAVVSARPGLARSECSLEVVVLRDRDDVEVRVSVGVLEDALYGVEAVAVLGVNVEVSFAHGLAPF